MALKDLKKDQIAELSNIEIAHMVLVDNDKEMLFPDLLKAVNKARGVELEGAQLASFYADLNSDGAFISLGKQEWGIRAWYPVDSIDEATHDGFDDEEEEETTKKKKKSKKDEDVIGFDEEDEDDDIIDTDDEEEDDDDDDTEDEDIDGTKDQEDVALGNDNQALDVLDANNDLEDLSDGDEEK